MSREPDNVNGLPPPGPPTDPLERALAELEPSEPRINRDRLMFQAGADSRRHVICLWQFTAGILAAVGFAAGARMYFDDPDVIEVERVVYRDREVPAKPAPPKAIEPNPEPLPRTRLPEPASEPESNA